MSGPDGHKVSVENQELISARDAGREMGRLLDELSHGRTDKFVITRHGKMVAAIVPLEVLALWQDGIVLGSGVRRG